MAVPCGSGSPQELYWFTVFLVAIPHCREWSLGNAMNKKRLRSSPPPNCKQLLNVVKIE